ncbi:tRNA threonylcarbamoyladenosine biosynthesis protein RimN [Lonepinella koalarum]|uniref:Sua5/YciO/YrdC/YwlC family protein n=1 Tax=Lonepinella koalarum TaxID=53417 RepID=UPI0011E3EEB0|nr:Sua5/YciO/YrdC/YwlC family protein [Lonepinella koalarum]TYG34906.1 tRNA threonylcarbamoyladenosine biosynthesis protein RimN [Lonepinella koalarum]
MNTLVNSLKSDHVIAYPTEAVFGLGCNPLSQTAVEKLLILKQRSVEKGLILVAPDINFLLPFIDTKNFTSQNWERLQGQYDHPTTWVVPVRTDVPQFLTGKFNNIAVRLCRHPAVEQLCYAAGFALTSTSANLTGLPPCKTAADVRSQFGENFPVLDMPVGNATNPSEIRDLFTNQLFRQG